MYQLSHDILFDNQGKKFKLVLLHSVEITSSVENLVDVAKIVLPEFVMNTPLDIESKIGRGTKVDIKLGYNNKLETEFVGFVTKIVNSGGALNIECEDALFMFKKSVPNKIFKPAKVADILKYLLQNVDSSYTLEMDADYGITYEKFTIYKAEAYDVLKKIQEELKANMFFDTSTKTLHFHAPYKHEGGKVSYDMSVNIESSSLEYKRAVDRKIEITVESTKADGTVKSITQGVAGGEKVTMKVGAMSEGDMKKIAQNALLQRNADKYEGSFDTWLVPFVKPSYRAKIIDADYPQRNGSYYVTSVTTSFSSSGGKRTINLGIKLG